MGMERLLIWSSGWLLLSYGVPDSCKQTDTSCSPYRGEAAALLGSAAGLVRQAPILDCPEEKHNDDSIEAMASPVVLRRSARLTAKAAAAICDRGASPSPEQEVIALKHGKVSAKVGKKAASILAKQEQMHEVIALKHGKIIAKVGKKATSILAKQEQISLQRGKISAYFGKNAIPGKKKEAVKEKKPAVETTCDGGNKSSVTTNTFLATQDISTATGLEPGDATRLSVKHERSLKKAPSRDLEAELWQMGFQHIAGVDEAGRGPLAGPVVAAACIIPSSITIEGINDSKKLSEERREELYSKLTTTPGISYAVHVIDAGTIDKVNILQATMQAMAACVEKLNSTANGLICPDFILVDGNRLPADIPEAKARSIVKGDASCLVIAAASILAKVTRDRLMVTYDEKWPMYGFKAHKGYGTAEHIAALRKHGPCDIHRRSFSPLKDIIILSASDL